jgi:hypothetical protein
MVSTEISYGVLPDPSTASFPNPARTGYFYITAGSYALTYDIRVVLNPGPVGPFVQATGTYTTPDGSTAGDPALTTPAKIAEELVTSLEASILANSITGITVSREGAYVVVASSTDDISVTSNLSALYMQTSGTGTIRASSELPALLPSAGANLVIQVGTGNAAVYYRYDATGVRWVEDAKYGTYDRHTLGVVITTNLLSGGISIDTWQADRRAAGDRDTNPDLKFVDGITGLSVFKGRVVLLAGQYICMSGVNEPTRWFRSTVAGLSDADPIEVADSVELSSPYHTAVPFNGGLLVSSAEYQAFVPGGLLTPRTATVSVVSNYSAMPGVSMVSTGRSTIVPFARTATHVGVREAVPPENFENVLIATDTTAHIPTYIAGTANYITASSTADVAVVGAYAGNYIAVDTDSMRRLWVHQFLWEGAEKRASAWHEWLFAHPLLHAYFLQDVLYVVFSTGPGTNSVFLGQMQLGRGNKPACYLDYSRRSGTNSGGLISIGDSTGFPHLWENTSGDIWGFHVDNIITPGTLLGELLEPTAVSGGIAAQTVATSVSTYIIGYKYNSEFEPTSPVVRDRSDNVLADANIPVVRFKAQVVDSGVIVASVQDNVYSSGDFEVPIIGLFAPVALGTGPLSASGTITVPARTAARDTIVNFATDDFYGLTVKTLEYGFKLSMKHRRA